MPNTLIIDSGFLLALANAKDESHQIAINCFQKFQNQQFITTWSVITETCYLLQTRVSRNAPQSLIRKVSTGNIQVFDLEPKHCPRIEELMNQYQNLPMDLADASLVILAEELGYGEILSVDYRDFNAYRWKNTQPFQNLLML
ncbi:type II toxin-antitoxin system VapC family toxin [Picosynechococcus sp. NKBG15041c]|uniref:type II toxin-antitoxin system VapC family toxin n=1 Tax=Picosynechococcus sp. NKBG15041c TaxID=1407650 RepID=UPI00040F9D50|nr:PIN domain-containing protein [Picosynechococcus sp. NKBG15041c]